LLVSDDAYDTAHHQAAKLQTQFQGTYWRHFKGNVYLVVGFDVGVDTDAPKARVQYVQVDDDGVITYPERRPNSRAWSNWQDAIDRPDYRGPRFVRVRRGDVFKAGQAWEPVGPE
jgi:hypothetical protein